MASQAPIDRPSGADRATAGAHARGSMRAVRSMLVALQPGGQKLRPQYAEKAFPLVKKGCALFTPRPRNKGVLFVTGVQRSGTTLLMRVFDRSWLTEVFHEHRPDAYDQYSLRDLETLRKLISDSSARVVVFKALIDSYRLSDLLDQFECSKAIWAFRHYDNVVNSHLRKWPTGRNRIDKIVVDPSQGAWRTERMSGESLETVRRLYKKGMNNAAAQALFWLYRNQLFFDQRLEVSDRVMLLNYDALVTNVDAESKRLAQFVNIPVNPRMAGIISSDAAGRYRESDLPLDIREACEEMYKSLLASWERQRTEAASDKADRAATG
jgi:hypothetical protein